MSDNTSNVEGWKWLIEKVVVPVIGSGGIVAIVVVLIPIYLQRDSSSIEDSTRPAVGLTVSPDTQSTEEVILPSELISYDDAIDEMLRLLAQDLGAQDESVSAIINDPTLSKSDKVIFLTMRYRRELEDVIFDQANYANSLPPSELQDAEFQKLEEMINMSSNFYGNLGQLMESEDYPSALATVEALTK